MQGWWFVGTLEQGRSDMMIIRTTAAFVASVGIATIACAQLQQPSQPNSPKPATTAAAEPAVGPHGGSVQQVGTTQFETLIEPGGLRLFAYDSQGQPLDLRAARGLATLQIKGDAKRYRYDLFPELRQDKSALSLAATVDLSRLAGRQVDVRYQLVGIPGSERRPAQFATSVTIPLTPAQQVAAAIAAQKVCPVSGLKLGGMGKPMAVTIGNQTIYVCCASCIDTLKANPTKFLTTAPTLHVAPATQADVAAITRQKLCPVMDEPLGSMGIPLKVSGLGRDVFLCCKGCLKSLQKEPQKYLAKLPPLPGATKLSVVKATKADARFVAAQELCPVMDKRLDAMGGPYKTVVEGRVVYLCCPGCAKKLHANSGVYLDKLASRGVKPPMVQ
jgi:YHS domain-containing protein